MEVMMVSTRPEGKDMLEGPGEVVAGVGIDSLEKTEGDPDVHGENVQVLGKVTVQQRSCNCSSAENHHFSGMSVFGCKTEWC